MKMLPPVLILLLLIAGTVSVAGLTPQSLPAKAMVSAKFTIPQNAVATVQETKTPVKVGHIMIMSDPSGAEIWAYGKDANIVTPWSADMPASSQVEVGYYSFALKYPGYQDYSETFTLEAGETHTINAKLNPLLSSSSPVVTSSEYLPSSNQQEPAGMPPALTTITGNQPSPASQAPAPGTGSLSVTTNPPGAAIEVDSLPQGASPATIPGLTSGTHNITITMPGYAALVTQVNIVGGQTMEYSTTLIPATNPTKPKAPGFEAAVAGLAVAGIVLLIRRP